jgi:hypothetical protein
MSQPVAGAAHGGVATILRLEGLVALIGAVLAYHAGHWNWLLFAILFLVPDLTMLGYLVCRTVGAVAYNAGHTYLAPATIAAAGLVVGSAVCYQIALIWAAHIGFDRVLGYGLKYCSGFGDTHLGRIGKGSGAAG